MAEGSKWPAIISIAFLPQGYLWYSYSWNHDTQPDHFDGLSASKDFIISKSLKLVFENSAEF